MNEPNARPNERPNADLTGVTIAEAATILGVTSDAVRMRLKRGSLPGRKVAGRWTVLLSVPPNAAPHTDPTETERATQQQTERPIEQPNNATVAVYEALVERQQAEIAFLQEQLRERDAAHVEEVRRRDHIIAGLVERLPALAGGQDAPTAHHDARHGAEGPDASRASLPRRLWRRLTGAG